MTRTKRLIFVVEDDSTIAAGLVAALEHEGFEAMGFVQAESALRAARTDRPDLVLSDVMLPGIDGRRFMLALKTEFPSVPVILLTARSDEIDRVMGLEMGADDYITKPFSSREVIARIRARLRERPVEDRGADDYTFGKSKVDLRRPLMWRDGVEISLTTHEAGTLWYLIAHRGRDVSREELLRDVWGHNRFMTTRTVDNQILKLRKKIEEPEGEPRHILTVHGTGYRFEP